MRKTPAARASAQDLAAIAELALPRTPSPPSKALKLASPLPLLTSDLTPPPSTQVPRYTPHVYHHDPTFPIGEPLSPTPFAARTASAQPQPEAWMRPIPNLEDAVAFPEDQLRDLVADLIPMLQESQLNLSHLRLQHNMLTIEASEAAERAAVEQEMTRREIEVLQSLTPFPHSRQTFTPKPTPSPSQSHRQNEVLLRKMKEIEAENTNLQHRLRQSKKIIKHMDAKNNQLVESNEMLRHRIRQNRKHFDEMREPENHGSRSTQSPEMAPMHSANRSGVRPQGNAKRKKGQDPFDALLFAGQVLSAEPSSVPSTPVRSEGFRPHPSHTRGVQSLSSLPTTPNRARPLTADGALQTPVNQLIPAYNSSFSAPATHYGSQRQEADRHERESTISVSDRGEAVTDDELPASQASQAASSMLRAFAARSQESAVQPREVQQLSQGKLVGKIMKPQPTSGGYGQKYIGVEDEQEGNLPRRKRTKLTHAHDQYNGLGIDLRMSPH